MMSNLCRDAQNGSDSPSPTIIPVLVLCVRPPFGESSTMLVVMRLTIWSGVYMMLIRVAGKGKLVGEAGAVMVI